VPYKDKERGKQTAKLWREANREKLLLAKREYYQANKEKLQARNKAWYQQNRSQAIASAAAWYRANKTRAGATKKKHKLKSQYGLTPEQVSAMLTGQAGLCAICCEPLRPGHRTHIDHCHVTGKVRAILCGQCNRGLGTFRDSYRLLWTAAEYVKRHQEGHG
jgi:hypothetical protein